jgi:rhodanese-related sulfurtransferase
VISRALAIFAVACLAGSIHLIVRGEPVRLSRATTPIDTVIPTDPTDPTDPISGDDPVVVSDPLTTVDPYASYAADPLFDEAVGPTHITLREAYTLHQAGATFLDARHDYEFEAGHIASAIFMPSTRLSSGEGIPQAYEIDASMPVVIYCTGGECDASENTAVLLDAMELGFDIRIMGKGYDEWAAVGLPVAEGSP